MANLLYISCNLNPVERSRCLTLGAQFLDEYLRWNPRDQVYSLDLFRDNIQHIDADVISAREKLAQGARLPQLSPEEQRKMRRIWWLADQFIACDKYVFVTPSWNLFFPAEFKYYIDAICEVEKTYRITELGAEGMLHSAQKKSLHLHALASHRFASERDLGAGYLSSLLNFLGVTRQTTVLLEGGDDPASVQGWVHEEERTRLIGLAQLF
ncbi:FMN-dependent NADH-azoreductase 2 [Geomonas limicola]|uniref:FMN dependent NADH:quinone oxidoreductase n=1 Tax=Geomonas limicola TaxID=2740186 RepID=A0A6V8N6M4_9BACT|nr:NAD(P)H-dependent oxidoreductase [Geomonas limicola]GFO66929.1 FMN-dependent NADH-azoreductase 2 [Geomonas limicola]